MNEKRVVWVDLLRIVATWGVICIHGRCVLGSESYSTEWVIWGGLFTPCVPLFLMLSGMLMLEKNKTVKCVLKSGVLKVFNMKMFSVMMCLLAGAGSAMVHNTGILEGANAAFWNWGIGTNYLAVLGGCYLTVPFLDRIIEGKLEEYFLILGAIFCFVIPVFIDVPTAQDYFPNWIRVIAGWIDYSEVFMPVGAAWIFCLGHYLSLKADKINNWLIILSLCVSMFLWLGTGVYVNNNPEQWNWMRIVRYGRYYGSYVSPLLLIYSASIFLFFKNMVGNIQCSSRMCGVINRIGKNSTIVFLVHGIIINIMAGKISHGWTKCYSIENFVEVTLYFCIALVFAEIVRKIPLLRKMI